MSTATLQALIVTLAGVDVTARCRGDLWRRQEASAAHAARIDIAVAVGDTIDLAGLLGATLTWSSQWAGDSARPRFSGRVQAASYDPASRRITLEATDGLQEWFEGRTEAQVDADIAGSKRHPAVQSERRDGWSQALDCLSTVQARYAIGRDGTHRLIPWAPAGTPDHTLGPADLLELGRVRVLSAPLRQRRNTVVWTIGIRAPVLREVLISAGWSSGATLCNYWADPWDLPPIERIASAVEGAGSVYRLQGTLGVSPPVPLPDADIVASGGIVFTLLAKTGVYNCTGTPTSYIRDDTACIAASWKWQIRWAQTLTLTYTLIVTAPDSVDAWGALIDERSATLNAEDDYSDWGSSQGGRPNPNDWAGSKLIAIDAAEEAAAIESALAEAAAAIAADHIEQVEIPLRPDRAAAIDLHHTVRLVTPGLTCTGVPIAIEERYDLATWQARCLLTLGVRRSAGPGGTDTPRVAPARPTVTVPAGPPESVSFVTRFGGRASSPPYDEAGRGVWTNYLTNLDAGAETYDTRAVFERPEVPAAASAEIEVYGTGAWAVYPGDDEWSQVAV